MMSRGVSPQFAAPTWTCDTQMPFESLQASVVPSGDHVTLPNAPCCAGIEHTADGVDLRPDTL